MTQKINSLNLGMKNNDKFNIKRFINFLNKKTREKNPKKIYTFDVIDAVDYSFENLLIFVR